VVGDQSGGADHSGSTEGKSDLAEHGDPDDPAIHRSLEAARKKGIVRVAAAGNAGAKSPPPYPAADPNVIAVSATDVDVNLFEQSNRGRYITVAAPGAQILLAVPDNGYEMPSGKSYSVAR
jgi:subtilisin family serine protease